MEYVVVGALVAVLILFALAPVLFRRVRGSDPRSRRYEAASREEPPSALGKDLYDFTELGCTHGSPKDGEVVTVHGTEIHVTDKVPVCAACFETWLNKYATRCASCDGPILPGMPVGQGWIGAPHPFTHMTMECCDSGGLYCGTWGQGRLITLHELDPEKYPAGSGNAMDAVLKTGKPIFQNLK